MSNTQKNAEKSDTALGETTENMIMDHKFEEFKT